MLSKRHMHPTKDYRDLGHYAIGTANLIPTSTLDKTIDPGLWHSSAQKPMLYFATGGPIEDHDLGKGHRRSMMELSTMDYSNYLKR